MQAGLRKMLGEKGVGKLAMFLYQQEVERERLSRKEPSDGDGTKEQAEAQTDTYNISTSAHDGVTTSIDIPPNWLTRWEKYHHNASWGFFAFRLAFYDDEKRWEEFKARMDKYLEQTCKSGACQSTMTDKIEAAYQKFEIRWIEDPDLAGAKVEELRVRFQSAIDEHASGFLQNLFLCVTSGAVGSLLSSCGDDEKLSTELKRGRSSIPYLYAVSAEASDAENGKNDELAFKPIFKVAVDALINQLWWQVDSDINPLDELTRWVKKSDELDEEDESSNDSQEEIWSSSAPPLDRVRKRMKLRGIGE